MKLYKTPDESKCGNIPEM